MIRWMHVYVILSKAIRTYLYNSENRLIIRFIRVVAFGVYFIAFLYLQFFLTKNNPSSSDPMYVLYAKYFLSVEIVTYYAQVFNMVFFLLWIQIRGQFGFKNYIANKDRYKYDALQYYKDDVQWLSFQIVPLCWKLASYFDRTHIGHANPMRNKFLWLLIANNIIAIFLLQPCRNQFRQLKIHSWKAWIFLYVVLGATWIVKLTMEPGWDKTFFMLSVDSIIIGLQTLLYYINYFEESDPNAQTCLRWKIFHIFVGYIPHTHGRKSKTETKVY